MYMTVKQRLIEFAKTKEKSVRAFEIKTGLTVGYVNAIRVSIQPDKIQRIASCYPDLNTGWLLTGEGEMLKGEQKPELNELNVVPLLPVSAQGGSLNDFVLSVKNEDCEKIISPIRGADFAITVSGESMAPEYPSGSKVLIKKIDEKAFIEWGRCYVLDTCNGTVIKKLAAPVENDPKFGKDYVTCISVNPNPLYSPFRVPLCDIYGIYRVMMSLSEK